MLTKEIKLAHKSKDGAEYKEFNNLISIPELGNKAKNIDITTLKDRFTRYEPGLPDYGSDVEFEFLYDNDETDSDYKIIKGYEASEEQVYFKLTFPDGEAVYFIAVVTKTISAAKPNEAIKFKMKTAFQSEITAEDPSTAAAAVANNEEETEE